MSISNKQINQSKVVIVGGSFAGLGLTRHLVNRSINNKAIDITIIEPKSYFEYTPGVLHLLSGSNAFSNIITSLDEICTNINVINGRFISISKDLKSINVIDNNSIKSELLFDVLVICSGTYYSPPIRPLTTSLTINQRIDEINRYRDKIIESKDILVVGGGLVGVELAADISYRLKRNINTITLLSRNKLLSSLPERAGRLATNWLIKNKVDVIIDEIKHCQLITNNKYDIITKSGRQLAVGLVIDCTGGSIKISDTYKDKDFSTYKSNEVITDDITPYNEAGLVPVDDSLRCPLFPTTGVFALGDVSEHINGVQFAYSSSYSTNFTTNGFTTSLTRPLVRNAHLAESQAELCADNIINYLNWKSNNGINKTVNYTSQMTDMRMRSYPKDVFGVKYNPLLACVSLGPRAAIVIFNNIVVGGKLFWLLGALVKYIIEKSKVDEIRNKPWARLFWAFGHVVVNFLHKVMVISQLVMNRFKFQSIHKLKLKSNYLNK